MGHVIADMENDFPPPPRPVALRVRRRRPIWSLGLLAVALLLLGALWPAADWWFCLPEGETSTYVGREACVGCHAKETQLWTGSDHDLAMELATPATVLGDFNDCRFTQVPFDDLGRLADDDLRTLVQAVPGSQWATAMSAPGPAPIQSAEPLPAAARATREKILAAMSAPDRKSVLAAIEWKKPFLRPCDVTTARQEIGDVARRLERQGKIRLGLGVTSTMFRRGDKFYATTEGLSGRLETFQVKYVFGVRPLQQYLVAFPDGRVQCLPIAWDTVKKQWFHLYPGERVPPGDELFWLRPLQNWNYMCAECHSTNLQKNYDPAANRYRTTWSEIDVSCETCHGPGSLHVKLADSWRLFWDRRYGYGLPRLKSTDSHVEIETCVPCHARRRIVRAGFPAGGKFLDHYVPETLDSNLYYADGQVLDEDYVYGSFLQSLMYRKGVHCSNCHDPHTVRIKFEDPRSPRVKYVDNRLCGQCHMPSKYDAVSHHHHPDASKPGTHCVECHMPETSYMVVDPRRDHSLRVPRPDLTVALGIPNACNGCHQDPAKGETPAWAVAWTEKWYGKPKGPQHFAYAFAAGRAGRPEAVEPLAAVVRRKDASPMVRASAILLLSGYGAGDARAAAFAGLEDADGLVRVAAVRSLEQLPPEELRARLAPLLHDPLRAVRTEAARILTVAPPDESRPDDRAAFNTALAEFFQGQEDLSDQPGAHVNVAVAYGNLGQWQKAEQAYLAALRIDPAFLPARNNLGLLYAQLGRPEKAEEQYLAALRASPGFLAVRDNLARLYYQEGKTAQAEAEFRKLLEQDPGSGSAHYALALLLAEDEKRLDETAKELAAAARLMPEEPRVHYNLGLALQKLGRPVEAEQALLHAYRLAPKTPEFLQALATLYAQEKRWAAAQQFAEDLCRLVPGDPAAQALWESIRREAPAATSPPPTQAPGASGEPKGP